MIENIVATTIGIFSTFTLLLIIGIKSLKNARGKYDPSIISIAGIILSFFAICILIAVCFKRYTFAFEIVMKSGF